MGYRGKVVEQNRARDLRTLGWTYNEIAAEVGVSKSSVSLWCREVEPDPDAWAARASVNRNFGARHARPHAQKVRKDEEIAGLRAEGRARIALLTEQEFLVAGTALYAGEGSKAVADPSIRRSKHPKGCASVVYAHSRTLRTVLGLTDALLTCPSVIPG